MSQATAFEFTQEGFQAVVAKMLELERLVLARTKTVSPPPGVYTAQDRKRSYSSESNNSLSSLEEYAGDSSEFTQMPCKPDYGKIVCSALLDGWLIHGSTYDHKDMIKENGGKWFGKCKGWALNDKSAVARILKEITLPKKLEKVKNSFQNLGLKFWKPTVKKEAPKPLSEDDMQEENAIVDSFLDAETETDTGTSTSKMKSCLIEESDDESDYELDDSETTD
jgi:hypothetical protein